MIFCGDSSSRWWKPDAGEARLSIPVAGSWRKAVRIGLTALLLAALVTPADLSARGKKKKKRSGRTSTELLNVFLSPANSQWLQGAISYLATDEEVEGYLALMTDVEAKEFVDRFWLDRDPHPDTPANPVRGLFDERSAEADKLYGESARPGHATDRGLIHVVYGPPEETRYDISSTGKQAIPGRSNTVSVETWVYLGDAEVGLDGRQPEKQYRFAKTGELTTFFVGRPGSEIQDTVRAPRNRR